ncbi:hypothetical protein HYY72_00550 [Candidatus Woesearchaeota archaeon]|nr:hypothetical protein [Candidatus Woesearchaeota archaeon]
MALDEIVIADKIDFIGTYHSGIPDYGIAYILESRMPGLAFTRAEQERVEQEGYHVPADSRTIRDYRKGKRTPKSIRGLDALAEIGVTLPLTAASPCLPEISRLFSMLFLSGGIDSNYHPGIHYKAAPGEVVAGHDGRLIPSRLKQEFPSLDLSFEGGEEKRIVINKAGNPLGRLAHIAGVPFEAKIRSSGGFLSYLPVFSERLKRHDLAIDERAILEGVCYDFISIFFSLKGMVWDNASNCYFRLKLPVLMGEGDAARQARQAADFLQSVLGIGNVKAATCRRERVNTNTPWQDSYVPILYVSKADFLGVLEQHGPRGDGRIDFSRLLKGNPQLEAYSRAG